MDFAIAYNGLSQAITGICPAFRTVLPAEPHPWHDVSWILMLPSGLGSIPHGIEVINSNYTGIGIGIGIEILFKPRIGIGIGIEYFLEKVIGIGIGIDQSNWCISSIPMKFQGHFFF